MKAPPGMLPSLVTSIVLVTPPEPTGTEPKLVGLEAAVSAGRPPSPLRSAVKLVPASELARSWADEGHRIVGIEVDLDRAGFARFEGMVEAVDVAGPEGARARADDVDRVDRRRDAADVAQLEVGLAIGAVGFLQSEVIAARFEGELRDGGGSSPPSGAPSAAAGIAASSAQVATTRVVAEARRAGLDLLRSENMDASSTAALVYLTMREKFHLRTCIWRRSRRASQGRSRRQTRRDGLRSSSSTASGCCRAAGRTGSTSSRRPATRRWRRAGPATRTASRRRGPTRRPSPASRRGRRSPTTSPR